MRGSQSNLEDEQLHEIAAIMEKEKTIIKKNIIKVNSKIQRFEKRKNIKRDLKEKGIPIEKNTINDYITQQMMASKIQEVVSNPQSQSLSASWSPRNLFKRSQTAKNMNEFSISAI